LKYQEGLEIFYGYPLFFVPITDPYGMLIFFQLVTSTISQHQELWHQLQESFQYLPP